LHGKRNGVGVYFFSNGDKYHGAFTDEKMDGKGVYECHDGSKIVGTWDAKENKN
jgi:hypothetical protein